MQITRCVSQSYGIIGETVIGGQKFRSLQFRTCRDIRKGMATFACNGRLLNPPPLMQQCITSILSRRV